MHEDATLPSVRSAWAVSTADDMHWHEKDWDADVERQGKKFDAWLREYEAEVIERLADAYPVITRDMVSRGSVRNWLLDQAERRRKTE